MTKNSNRSTKSERCCNLLMEIADLTSTATKTTTEVVLGTTSTLAFNATSSVAMEASAAAELLLPRGTAIALAVISWFVAAGAVAGAWYCLFRYKPMPKYADVPAERALASVVSADEAEVDDARRGAWRSLLAAHARAALDYNVDNGIGIDDGSGDGLRNDVDDGDGLDLLHQLQAPPPSKEQGRKKNGWFSRSLERNNGSNGGYVSMQQLESGSIARDDQLSLDRAVIKTLLDNPERRENVGFGDCCSFAVMMPMLLVCVFFVYTPLFLIRSGREGEFQGGVDVMAIVQVSAASFLVLCAVGVAVAVLRLRRQQRAVSATVELDAIEQFLSGRDDDRLPRLVFAPGDTVDVRVRMHAHGELLHFDTAPVVEFGGVAQTAVEVSSGRSTRVIFYRANLCKTSADVIAAKGARAIDQKISFSVPLGAMNVMDSDAVATFKTKTSGQKLDSYVEFCAALVFEAGGLKRRVPLPIWIMPRLRQRDERSQSSQKRYSVDWLKKRFRTHFKVATASEVRAGHSLKGTVTLANFETAVTSIAVVLVITMADLRVRVPADGDRKDLRVILENPNGQPVCSEQTFDFEIDVPIMMPLSLKTRNENCDIVSKLFVIPNFASRANCTAKKDLDIWSVRRHSTHIIVDVRAPFVEQLSPFMHSLMGVEQVEVDHSRRNLDDDNNNNNKVDQHQTRPILDEKENEENEHGKNRSKNAAKHRHRNRHRNRNRKQNQKQKHNKNKKNKNKN